MCYFKNATQKTQITIDAICHELKNPKFGKIDLVVGTGLSGTLLLVPIHLQSEIPFGVVRKKQADTHSSRNIEVGGIRNLRNIQRYVIVDDFVDSGDTIDNIKLAMSRYECVGIILYQSLEELESHDGILDGVPYVCLEQDIEEIEEEIVSVV